MLPFKLVYHPGYDLNLGSHVFPSTKYRLIRERLLDEGFAGPGDFDQPEPATDEQVLLVHDPGWVSRLKEGKLSYAELLKLEIPYSRQTIDAFWLAAGGSILAGRNALRDRVGFNIGGGFHHAFRAHGEGFCAINDIAIAIRTLQSEGAIERAMVIDCDVHHGNGTAAIFAGDPNVFTISIHQFDNYPSEKPPSSVDIDLPDLVEDEQYLQLLQKPYAAALAAFRPNLVVFVAGADPYKEDQLGGLSLTIDGLRRRDLLVTETALAHQAAVLVVLAGGYAVNVHDTVTIHCNTVKTASQVLADKSLIYNGTMPTKSLGL
jgi:acetoin utilization deacetylase AcuC-like enzyme